MPVWREDEKGRAYSLIITSAGRTAVGGDKAEKQTSTSKSGQSELIPARAARPRGGTKQALIVEMLSQEQGATLAALIDATGWAAPYDPRGADGLRKKGYAIERLSGAGAEPSAYRIVDFAKHAA